MAKTKEPKVEPRAFAMPPTNFATAKLMVRDMNRNYLLNRSYNTKYNRQQIKTYLENPQVFEDALREVSRFLYYKSQHYQRLIDYFSGMATFDYMIMPSKDITGMQQKKVKTQYLKVADFLEKMNLKHEMSKALRIAWREDVFYGYEIETNESYFILPLDGRYCRITGIEDGVFTFSFDFSYFSRDVYTIQMFPREFQQKYVDYVEGRAPRWQSLSEKQVCFKVREDTAFVIPPFAGIIESLYDLDEYKELRKDQQVVGNYKVLVQELPMKKDSDRVNDFLIDFDTMKEFHNKAAENLPDQVGLITSPMKISSQEFEKGSAYVDLVANSERDYWGGTGVSQLLFNAQAPTGVGLDSSITTDEMMVFGMVRQVERWLNRKIKTNFKNFPFKAHILTMTHLHQDAYLERIVEASTLGFSTKLMVGAALGMSPIALESLAFLENDVLSLPDNMIPVSSTHTMGADGQMQPVGGKPANGKPTGAPKKKSSELTPNGAKSRNNGSNATTNKQAK